MFSPLKRYKIQHQEFCFAVFPVTFERWKIFFQLCTRILLTDYVEMSSKCVYTVLDFDGAYNYS